ncbi:MAG: 5-(carboxyamino)imidazole ribonucleotide synthase [Hyphomicrobiaceae bacterium]
MAKTRAVNILVPGSTIGILGGGQLGRMLSLAAARLGFKSHVYSDEPDSPAFEVSARSTQGSYSDLPHLEAFAREVDVVTYEFENVPVTVAQQLSEMVDVRPGARALEVAQDRFVEKEFVAGLGIAVAPFAEVSHRRDLVAALERLAGPGAILKTRRLGYDGKGQVALGADADPAAALATLGHRPAILEQRVQFEFEISVLVVRSVDGECAFYDCPANSHEGGILRRSVVPAQLPREVVGEARDIAAKIASALDYVGVLAVEMFYAGSGCRPRLMVNEIAPRVHNSGHWTIEACGCSQFENHIRAVAGWPLGDTRRHSDAEMVNLIGEEANWWQGLAGEPGVCLHLYGKRDAREGRKMGHWTRLSPRRDGAES